MNLPNKVPRDHLEYPYLFSKRKWTHEEHRTKEPIHRKRSRIKQQDEHINKNM